MDVADAATEHPVAGALSAVDESWDVDAADLVARVNAVVAACELESEDRRAAALVDSRTLRWYRTVGLVDPPTGRVGRHARFSRRHLVQAVTVKALQAAGWSLARIQERTAGRSEDALVELAVAVLTEQAAADAADAELPDAAGAGSSLPAGSSAAAHHRAAPAPRPVRNAGGQGRPFWVGEAPTVIDIAPGVSLHVIASELGAGSGSVADALRRLAERLDPQTTDPSLAAAGGLYPQEQS